MHILIVDDHRLFNDGLRAMLSDEPRITVVGQVYDSREALRQVHLLSPTLVLLDFNMPYFNGLEISRQLVADFPNTKLLILSMYAEQRYVTDFRRAGAKGYLLKTAGCQEVTEAILTIAQGGQFFQPLRTAGNTYSGDEFLKQFSLTPREVEIIRYVREGLSNQQIADRLTISFHTVETHRRTIRVKLGINSTSELMRFALENNI